ncbi:anthranilate synthase component I family protein [Neobacillus sp. D3-1R]|uniref:anthranilate synthase component I family protein n=1 Tax=Neobacillus sp. D3-1R TaxID=3445778 RepID=UPI003FA0C481
MTTFKLKTAKIPFSLGQFFHQYRHISKDYTHHVFLESGRGGQYSIAAFQPIAKLIGKNGHLQIETENGHLEQREGNPLHLMREWMKGFEIESRPDIPDFKGGAIGFISYDYARYIEKLPNWANDDLHIPDICFFVYKEWFIFDHTTSELWLLFLHEENENIENKMEQWLANWQEFYSSKPQGKSQTNEDKLEVSMNETEFMDAVAKVQNYISAGDVFQVNLSVRQTKELAVSAMDVYEKLRILNPSPYMGYFHTPEFQMVSGSPELLVKKKGLEVSTRPIAGTRSRGKDEAEDIQLANELIENEKERAEHVMLVDLERNDLGRVSQYGTVEVNEFMVIEKYSHVMHIVSNVRGRLAQDKDVYDVIDAVFPGGTITGAPKVRTMEIIEELEPVRRGIYTGSLGWIGFDNDMELNIVIRTMLVKDGQAHVQAGAGIVIDSIPSNEYKESLKKAIALWKAKEESEKAGELR